MQKILSLLMVSLVVLTGARFHHPVSPVPDRPITAVTGYFRRDAAGFAGSAERLRTTVRNLSATGAGRDSLGFRLREARLQYKKIESFLAWFFPTVAAGINGPPVPEGEDPFMEYQEPCGLQVIEAALGDSNRKPDLRILQEQTDLLAETAASLPALLYKFSGGEAGLLQSIRLALIRVTTLGITGYDAPGLQSGIAESAIVCENIREQLRCFPGTGTLLPAADKVILYLRKENDFNRFDRLQFLKSAMIPFLGRLKTWCAAGGFVLPATGLLQQDVTDIYSPGALRTAAVFPAGKAMQALGRSWFSDRSLSGQGLHSCASCHDPARAFTDGLMVSRALDPRVKLKRNTPTLLYSGYQHRQFWDGKADGLESQIVTVLHDPLEMGLDTVAIEEKWRSEPGYSNRIAAAFPGKSRPSPSRMIALAVGAYVNTLGRFNAPFDCYLRGDSNAIGADAKAGFNLFMGKARCGSCHFAPVFNGTLPPEFARTEFEIPGTTDNTDFSRPRLSADPGRYSVYPLPFNRHSFKTPTIRNAARTAPYMHNGRFRTLQQVLTFYNNGGGAGMGLDVPGQTLASEPLHLDQNEMKQIIAFINTLNDKPEEEKQ